jgi:hypothetical protein
MLLVFQSSDRSFDRAAIGAFCYERRVHTRCCSRALASIGARRGAAIISAFSTFIVERNTPLARLAGDGAIIMTWCRASAIRITGPFAFRAGGTHKQKRCQKN